MNLSVVVERRILACVLLELHRFDLDVNCLG